jgi:hypothetical protein
MVILANSSKFAFVSRSSRPSAAATCVEACVGADLGLLPDSTRQGEYLGKRFLDALVSYRPFSDFH